MGATFQREPFAAAWPEIAPLVAAHWQEIAYPGGFPADDAPRVDTAVYQAAEDDGRLVFFTVRESVEQHGPDRQIGPLTGYAAFWIGPFPQRQGLIGAWQEAVFILRAHRSNPDGVRFLGWCDEQLRALGVSVVHHSVRSGRDFSPALLRLGYVQADVIYARHLGADHGQQ